MNQHVPVYAHNCDYCKYLGPYGYTALFVDGPREITVDLYACPPLGDGLPDYTSMIARFSDEVPGYSSLTIDSLKRSGLLKPLLPQAGMGTYTWALREAYDRYTDNKREG